MAQYDDIRSPMELDVGRRRVLAVVDLDCPVDASGELLQDAKAIAAAETVGALMDLGAQVTVAGYVAPKRSDAGGTESKRVVQEHSRAVVEAFGMRLAELLQSEVFIPDENLGPLTRKLLAEQRDKTVVLFNDLALDRREHALDEDYARELIAPFEAFVGDALLGAQGFATSSLSPRYCAQRAGGITLRQELENFDRALRTAAGKSCWCIGESFGERQLILRRLMSKRPTLLPGATLAATLMAANGRESSLPAQESALLADARTWLKQAHDAGVELLLPVDLVCYSEGRRREIEATRLTATDRVVDLGPKTLERYENALDDALSTALLDTMSGTPLGEPSKTGLRSDTDSTLRLLDAMGNNSARSYVVVPEQLEPSALTRERRERLGYVSWARSGVVALLEGKKVPSVEALRTPN